MMLRVGPFLYRVRFVQRELWLDGERCLGICDNETHEIFVASHLSFAQQVQVICHEYMEAWLYHFGPAGGGRGRPDEPGGAAGAHGQKEAYCDVFGMAMAQFVMDLIHQFDQLGRTAAGTAMGAGAAAPGPSGAPSAAACEDHHGPARDWQTPAAATGHASASAGTGEQSPVAAKLARAAARAGLRVTDVHEPSGAAR